MIQRHHVVLLNLTRLLLLVAMILAFGQVSTSETSALAQVENRCGTRMAVHHLIPLGRAGLEVPEAQHTQQQPSKEETEEK